MEQVCGLDFRLIIKSYMSKKKFSNYVWGSNVITLKYIIDIDSNLSSNDINNAKLSE